MNEIEQVISGLERLSLLAQLRDKVIAARDIDRRECGNCYFWMKSRDCPRERNVNGATRGPSCSEPACGKFQIEQRVLDLKAHRVREAFAFAERYDLPTPPRT